MYATRLSIEECAQVVNDRKMPNYPVKQKTAEEAYLALEHGLGLGETGVSQTDQYAIMERIRNGANKDQETSSNGE